MALTAVLSAFASHPANVVETSLPDPFERVGVIMSFGLEEEVYAQDEDADLVYRIIDGAVRSVRLLSDGRRQIGGFYYRGDLFGLEAGPVHRSAAEALSQTKVLVLRRSALKHYGEVGERLERSLWRATGDELSRARDHMLLLARKSALERVAGFLDDVVRRLGDGWAELPMARQDIADYLGLTVETVSRMLTQLQAEQVVQFQSCRRFRVSAPDRLASLVAA